MAEHFVVSPHQYGTTIHYSEVATWYGALTYSGLTHDDALRGELIRRFEPMMPGAPEANRTPQRRHVGGEVFGVVPLQISIQTKNARYLSAGTFFADRQRQDPLPDGLSGETRFWIDDMYMLTILRLEAYRATGDRTYLDRCVKEMVAYLDKLQPPNGLFYHAPDAKFYWGRGDGWWRREWRRCSRSYLKIILSGSSKPVVFSIPTDCFYDPINLPTEKPGLSRTSANVPRP